MNIIVKFSSEITIKSRSVRVFFSKVLVSNIRIILKKYEKSVLIIRHWDYIEIKCNHNDEIYALLRNIPGIHHFFLTEKNVFNSLLDIYEKIICVYFEKLQGKSFSVRVKRCGDHNFTSQEVECYLGDKIRKCIHSASVNLKKPDEIIYLEIKKNYFFLIVKRYEGLGGLPIGTQQEVLSLISGGFDSAVSSYMLIRRGCKVHYCFFNFGKVTYTEEVYRIAYYLWSQFSKSHMVKFISVDFSEVAREIINNIKSNYVGIILKRMMIRAASAIASYLRINALLTGEVLGQVSSQTLDNINLIDHVSNHVIFRPLISFDKETIIELSKKIGTEKLSKLVPEYCAVVSKSSITQTTKQCVEFEEKLFNFMILDNAISRINVLNIKNVSKKLSHQIFLKIETKTILCDDDIILDIRTKNEQIKAPLFLDNIKIQNIPFYELVDKFSELDQSKIYFLYCNHGIMSRLQAVYLYNQGFFNVKIYRPNFVLNNNPV